MKKILFVVFITLSLLFGFIGPRGVQTVVAQQNPQVCPNGEGWHKVEAGDSNFLSYSADEGYIVTAICAKGGNEEHSQGGYLITMETNGTYDVDGQVCLTFAGIGTGSGSVSRNTQLTGNICSELSHASFKVGQAPPPDPTPEDPTPDPTPEDPTPDPTPEDPTPDPTPEDPTPDPTPVNPTPNPTPDPISPPEVDTETPTGGGIVGPVLLGAGLIGGTSGLTIFFRKRKMAKK